jgi:hypothetical protein
VYGYTCEFQSFRVSDPEKKGLAIFFLRGCLERTPRNQSFRVLDSAVNSQSKLVLLFHFCRRQLTLFDEKHMTFLLIQWIYYYFVHKKCCRTGPSLTPKPLRYCVINNHYNIICSYCRGLGKATSWVTMVWPPPPHYVMMPDASCSRRLRSRARFGRAEFIVFGGW